MLERPELTFPKSVADFVTRTYENSGCVLEYGSGGSTVLAAEIEHLTCFSVESDKKWADGLRTWLDTNVPDHSVKLHYCNIGKTGAWGMPEPVRKVMVPRYAQYPRSVWRRSDFVHPDVVLIDGRFRVGCFLTVLSNIQKPTKILFDDYKERSNYHVVEHFFKPVQYVERMAEFDVEPRRLSLGEWRTFLKPSLWPI